MIDAKAIAPCTVLQESANVIGDARQAEQFLFCRHAASSRQASDCFRGEKAYDA